MTAPTTKEWLRAAVDRIALGSTRLVTHHAGRALRAVTARVGRWPWWVQLGLAALALRGGLPAMTALGGWVHRKASAGGSWLFIAAALWLLAAYRVGHPDRQTDTDPVPEPETDDEPSETASDGHHRTAGPSVVSPTELVAAVRDIGTPHAQLKPLAEHLGTTTDAVRAAAGAVGWPVKDVRMEGRSSSAGLRWDDCPSPTILAPSSGVVGAGQPADDDNDDTEGEHPREGLRVQAIGQGGRLVHDPADAVRHHQIKSS
jgi:hypothetical protein